jgi:thiosulfate dehydrogenase
VSSSAPVWPIASVLLASLTGIGGWWLGQTPSAPPAPAAPPAPVVVQAATAGPTTLPEVWPFSVPDPSTRPTGPLGDAINRGEHLLSHTRAALPDHVGADANCTSCHLKGGTVPGAGPWVGIAGLFPMYRARSAAVNTLEDRVNDCFERSLNGVALDPDSDEMKDIVAYMAWLSRGVPVGLEVEGRGFQRAESPPTPDPAAGEALYTARCAVCHQPTGAGLVTPDGTVANPALWGERSFNVGAGMARLDTAAAFIRSNMPLGQGGTLTEQEAYDLAAFVIHQPRPDFPGKANDWPAGGKPRDARY